MAPAKQVTTQERILEALLDLIAERGFHDSPISLLAKRAKTGPGLIYHYFPSKEELIHAVYVHVRTKKREALKQGYSKDLTPEEAYKQKWLRAYHFYRTHKREARFLEQYESSPFCGSGQEDRGADYSDDQLHFLASFRPRRKGGLIHDMPPEAIHALSFGLALKLATREAPLKSAALKTVVDASWRALTGE